MNRIRRTTWACALCLALVLLLPTAAAETKSPETVGDEPPGPDVTNDRSPAWEVRAQATERYRGTVEIQGSWNVHGEGQVPSSSREDLRGFAGERWLRHLSSGAPTMPAGARLSIEFHLEQTAVGLVDLDGIGRALERDPNLDVTNLGFLRAYSRSRGLFYQENVPGTFWDRAWDTFTDPGTYTTPEWEYPSLAGGLFSTDGTSNFVVPRTGRYALLGWSPRSGASSGALPGPWQSVRWSGSWRGDKYQTIVRTVARGYFEDQRTYAGEVLATFGRAHLSPQHGGTIVGGTGYVLRLEGDVQGNFDATATSPFSAVSLRFWGRGAVGPRVAVSPLAIRTAKIPKPTFTAGGLR